jgi:RHS repeat-associated protein
LTGTPYWQADSRQADGQLTQETYGNGVVGIREYQPETGLLETLTTDGPAGQLDQIVYGYDNNRNVRDRDDLVGQGARAQTFLYDSLDRLVTWTHQLADGSDPVTTAFDHDKVGNLLSEVVTGRSGRNVTYAYGQNGAPPHALTRRNSSSYSYDGAGRRTAGAALTSITYNRRNLPIRIQRSSAGTTEMAYDAAGSRVLKRRGDVIRLSVGGVFERTLGGTQVVNHHYILAEGRVVAQVAHVQEDPVGPVVDTEVRYIHSDGQGSAVQVTNESGAVLADLFYDPFGRRTDRNYDPLTGNLPVRPGYTGHLHDDELGLMDMKGRVYDIEARRFLTPDPFIQAPLFSQSHNRYSYVWNNPATNTDPTGFDCTENVQECGDGSWFLPGSSFLTKALGPVNKGAGAVLGPVAGAVNGFLSTVGGIFGGGSDPAPISADNNPTDIVSTGSGDGVVTFPDAASASVADDEITFDFGFGSQDGRQDGIGDQEWKYGNEMSTDGLISLMDGSRWGILPSMRVLPDTRKAFEGAMIVASYVGAAFSGARSALVALEKVILSRLPAGTRLAWQAARGTAKAGWEKHLPEARQRLEAAKAKYGDHGLEMMARKSDIRQIDRIVKEVGLNKNQRRLLHDEITGQDLSLDEIADIARDIAQRMPKGN